MQATIRFDQNFVMLYQQIINRTNTVFHWGRSFSVSLENDAVEYQIRLSCVLAASSFSMSDLKTLFLLPLFHFNPSLLSVMKPVGDSVNNLIVNLINLLAVLLVMLSTQGIKQGKSCKGREEELSEIILH